MHRSPLLIAAALAMAFCVPTLASEQAAKPVAEHGGSKDDAGEKKPKDGGGLFGSDDNIVPLPVIIAPVVSNGYLTSHLYMFLAAVTPSAEEAGKLKEKMPYLLDDLILTVYQPPTILPARAKEPDYGEIVGRVRASINRTMGRDIVTAIKVGKIDTAPY
jgi:hypothetical protein